MSAHPVGVAHARAGILGNPSDGYGGKALACSVRNFAARTAIEPSDAWTIVANDVATELAGIDGAVDAPVPGECEGLSRLVFAASRRFVHDFRSVLRIKRPFALTCRTDIPRQVGLAGSSAVIIATMRALATHFDVDVSPFDLERRSFFSFTLYFTVTPLMPTPSCRPWQACALRRDGT